MELFSHPFYSFVYSPQQKIIAFRWTPDTLHMQMHDYQEALHNFAGFAREYPGVGLLVDIREFRYRPSPDLGNWRDDAISPRYARAGVRKFAYVAPPGALEKMKGAMSERQRGFEESYFGDETQAVGWLTS